jgi:hypothetical protein
MEPPPRKLDHGMFHGRGISLSKAAAPALFVGGSAMRTNHDTRMAGMLEGMKTKPANHAVGQRPAFRPGMQYP